MSISAPRVSRTAAGPACSLITVLRRSTRPEDTSSAGPSEALLAAIVRKSDGANGAAGGFTVAPTLDRVAGGGPTVPATQTPPPRLVATFSMMVQVSYSAKVPPPVTLAPPPPSEAPKPVAVFEAKVASPRHSRVAPGVVAPSPT